MPVGEGKKVVQISAGGSHSAVLLQSGEVLTFGYGDNNRLGHGDNVDELLPKAIASLRRARVVEVVAGDMQTAVLTAAGDLVAFYEQEEEDDAAW